MWSWEKKKKVISVQSKMHAHNIQKSNDSVTSLWTQLLPKVSIESKKVQHHFFSICIKKIKHQWNKSLLKNPFFRKYIKDVICVKNE